MHDDCKAGDCAKARQWCAERVAYREHAVKRLRGHLQRAIETPGKTTEIRAIEIEYLIRLLSRGR